MEQAVKMELGSWRGEGVSVHVVSVNGYGQWLVDSRGRLGGGPGSRRRGPPSISLDNRKTSIFAHTTGVFWAVYEPNMYLRPCNGRMSIAGYLPKNRRLRPDPTQPGSSYYYLLTTSWPGAPHWLLTGVLMSNVGLLTQNFGRMSFEAPF